MWYTQVSLPGPELAGEPGRLTWNRVQSGGGWIQTSSSDPLGEYETSRRRLYFSNLTLGYFLIASMQRSQVISCTLLCKHQELHANTSLVFLRMHFSCAVQAQQQNTGSVVGAHGFSCAVARGILVLPPGITSISSALQGEFLTARPPGKSLEHIFYNFELSSSCLPGLDDTAYLTL